MPSLSNPTILVLAAVCSLAISFQVLLPVAPVLLERSSPHGAAGAATAALFVATVVGDFLTPWLMSRWAPSRLLIAGGLLIAVPSLIYMFPHAKAWQMLLAAGVRGLGIGVAIVVCVALLGELAPSNRRGRWIGYFGLATGIPGIVCPSIGVALLATSHADLATWIAFLGGSCVSLVALRLRRCSVVRPGIASNLFVAIRQPGLLALFGGFVLASCTFGGVITYAPVALPPDGLGSAALFLLITGASRAASRSLAGILGDHQPVRPILILGILLSIVGLVALAVRGGPVLVLIAAAAYGIGIGGVQTGAYLAMTQRSSSLSWSVMSAVWNIAIDLGGSVGGALIGLSAALSGYSTAAWVMPATLLVALPLLWPAQRSISVPPASESART